MSRARVGFFDAGGFVEVASGSLEFCRGYLEASEGAGRYYYRLITSPVCECGGLRREITKNTQGFKPQTGCLRCDLWDGPAEVAG